MINEFLVKAHSLEQPTDFSPIVSENGLFFFKFWVKNSTSLLILVGYWPHKGPIREKATHRRGASLWRYASYINIGPHVTMSLVSREV